MSSIAMLKLIDRTNSIRAWAKTIGVSKSLIKAACKRPWVADITNGNRTFMKGMYDYRWSNSDGSKDVVVSFVLWPDRIYEVCEPDLPVREVRYKCKVVDGVIVRI